MSATWAGSWRVNKVKRAEGRPRSCLDPRPPGIPLSPHRDRSGSDLPLRGPCHPRFLGNWMAQMRRRQRACLGLSCYPPVGRPTYRHWPSCFRSSWKPSTRRSSECWLSPALPLGLESDLKARAHVLSHHLQGLLPTQHPFSIQESPRMLPEVSCVNIYICPQSVLMISQYGKDCTPKYPNYQSSTSRTL